MAARRAKDDATEPGPEVAPGNETESSRRIFLRGAVKGAGSAGAVAAALPAAVLGGAAAAQPAPAPAAAAATAPAAGYQCLSLEEAALTEAMVDHMWPADSLGPSGTELGIATFIDRQLAGAFGGGDRLYLQGPFRKGKPQHGYQLPLTPAQYYKAGAAGMGAACRTRFGKSFDKLAAAEREAFLQDLAAGRVKADGVDLGAWFNGLVYPMFNQGAFADPIYGGNRNKAAWKLIGYPGLPAVYGQDVVRYRGKPHPRSATPQSIQDLS